MGALAIADLWKPLTVAALIVAAFAYRAALIHQRDVARAQVLKLTAQVADLEADNRGLQAAIATQNAAVADLKAQAERATALVREREQSAMRSGTAAMDTASRQADVLAHAAVDPRCDAAIRWGNEQAVRLGRW
jgi:cell division protein FtsB